MLHIISLEVDFRKTKEYSFPMNPSDEDRTLEWDVHATAKGSHLFGNW